MNKNMYISIILFLIKKQSTYIYNKNKTVFVQLNFINILNYGENITLGT